MRLGFDAWGLSGDVLYTGMGQYACHLMRALAQTAPHIEIVAYGAPAERRPEWLPAAVEWRTTRTKAPEKLAALASRLLELRGQAEADRLDLFHAPAVHVRPSLPPIPSLPVPVVATVHDLIPLTHYGHRLPMRNRLFYRWNLGRAMAASRIVTVSEHARGQIVSRVRVKPERVVAIPNGVAFGPNNDDTALERLGISRPYILFAGSYEPRKNLRSALSAYALLRESGVEQQFVAVVERTSGHAADVHAHARALGLDGSMRFVHSLPDDDLRSVYTHADAVLFPSFDEGFGFPPLQAALCGVPVVASDIPAVRETMSDAAHYVDPHEPSQIAQALHALLTQQGRHRPTKQGRERALQYTWERAAREYVELYRAVAGDGGPLLSST